MMERMTWEPKNSRYDHVRTLARAVLLSTSSVVSVPRPSNTSAERSLFERIESCT